MSRRRSATAVLALAAALALTGCSEEETPELEEVGDTVSAAAGDLGDAGRQAAEAALAADRAEDEIRRLRARAVGHAELAWSDPGSAQVREAFDRLETGLAAERELERLKERRAIEGG